MRWLRQRELGTGLHIDGEVVGFVLSSEHPGDTLTGLDRERAVQFCPGVSALAGIVLDLEADGERELGGTFGEDQLERRLTIGREDDLFGLLGVRGRAEPEVAVTLGFEGGEDAAGAGGVVGHLRGS